MTMCPSYAFIDRADGKVNGAMDFKKDYSGLISAAWDIDTKYDAFLNNPEEDSYTVLKSMGLIDYAPGEFNDTASDLSKKIADGEITGSFAARYGGKE